MSSIVGIAIAVHNKRELLRACLDALQGQIGVDIVIVVVDGGSTDGTWDMLSCEFSRVRAVRGNDDLWWTAGTNFGIKECLQARCDYILLLNPDVIVEHDTIARLLSLASRCPMAIVAPVVVRHENPEVVWWAGSEWRTVTSYFPFIWTNRYFFKAGVSVKSLPSEVYKTSEAHGRAVLVPAEIFRQVGLYDAKRLPHYGADTDFSFRAEREGYSILIAPQIRVRLHSESTGMKPPDCLRSSWRGYWNYLTKRKNGEALRVWWYITQRHLPWYSAIPSYLAILGWNSYRYWSRLLQKGSSNQGSQ